eukprot:4987986-Pyramimonas_sp.AAC.1
MVHIKKCEFATEMCETYFIRPSNGHSSPGIKCLESFYTADLTFPGAPGYFIYGTQWVNIPNILRTGLACRADGTTKRNGRQFVHACPYLPGDNILQSGLRVDSEVLISATRKSDPWPE